jgi:hypothetical protein
VRGAALRGANNCIYDTRAMASEMQRTYADSNNGDGTGYSWQHYTDNCNACPSGNTNSYGPDNLFDDPISYPSAGGDFCTDSEHTFGFASINMTVPTLITSYKLRARNWNEFPKHFVFQGSNDWVTWTDIETRYISKKMATNEERVFWVGVPANTPGIPDVTMDAFNVNPLGYMTLDPVTQQIVDSAADPALLYCLSETPQQISLSHLSPSLQSSSRIWSSSRPCIDRRLSAILRAWSSSRMIARSTTQCATKSC